MHIFHTSGLLGKTNITGKQFNTSAVCFFNGMPDHVALTFLPVLAQEVRGKNSS